MRRRASLLAGAAVFYVVSWIMMYFGAPAWAVVIEIGLAFSLVVAFGVEGYKSRSAGSLRADQEGLHFDDRMLVAKRALVMAYVQSTDKPVVRLIRRGRSAVDVRFDDHDQARALLGALGFGVDQSVVRYRGVGTAYRLLSLAFVASLCASIATHQLRLFGAHADAAETALLGAALLASVWQTLLRGSAHVVVGGDGILIRRGRDRFIPYAALASASVDGRGITLTLRSGETLGLRIVAGEVVSGEALVHRIEEARARFELGADGGSTEVLVAPGGRPVPRWVSEVRSLARVRQYREASVDAERLWRVVNDPSAPPATRAGAAVALSGTANEETRIRLRVAAEACADPTLRVALARVADGADDEQLAEALGPLASRVRNS
jgi:hypothetical protein